MTAIPQAGNFTKDFSANWHIIDKGGLAVRLEIVTDALF